MNKVIIYSFLALVLVSCGKQQVSPLPEFRKVEAVVWEHPDSSLALLKTIKRPSPSDELNDATWCLLMTQARDRNYIRHTSDSLITVALNYFEKHGTPHRKAMALFYAGEVYNDLKNYETATDYYIRAKDIAKTTSDYRLTYLICVNTGMLYAYRQELKKDAKKELREAHSYAVKSGDSTQIASSLCSLGRIYGIFGQWDSVAYFYSEAMKIAERTRDLRWLSIAQSEIAQAYIKLGTPEQAVVLLRNSMKIKIKEKLSGLPQAYLSLGEVYESIHKGDSALFYLNKALDTNNLYTIRNAYWHLYDLYKEKGLYKKALDYRVLYKKYEDSIQHVAHSTEIKEIREKYENEKLVNENNSLKIRQGNLIRTSLLIFIVLLLAASAGIIRSQRKLLNKERLLQKIRNELQMHLAKLKENEDAIRTNELVMEKISGQAGNADAGKNDHGEIELIRENNYLLQGKNDVLKEKVAAYTAILQEKELKLVSYDKLQKQNEELARRERFLMGQLEKQVDVLKELRYSTRVIKPEEWPEIISMVNQLNNNFTLRLKRQMPFLSESDIQCCCLIKLRLPTAAIANLTAISPASVTKRKQRIRGHISEQANTSLGEKQSLDDFLWKF